VQADAGGAIPIYTSRAFTPASPIKSAQADAHLWDNELFHGCGSSCFAVTAFINRRVPGLRQLPGVGARAAGFRRSGRSFGKKEKKWKEKKKNHV